MEREGARGWETFLKGRKRFLHVKNRFCCEEECALASKVHFSRKEAKRVSTEGYLVKKC